MLHLDHLVAALLRMGLVNWGLLQVLVSKPSETSQVIVGDFCSRMASSHFVIQQFA